MRDATHWRTRRDTKPDAWHSGATAPRTPTTPPHAVSRPIDLHIGTFVLDGVAVSRRDAVVRALQAELDALCADLSRRGTKIDARDGRFAAAEFVPTDSPAGDGRAIAQALFRALRLDASATLAPRPGMKVSYDGGE
jgi:hypothetical protein